MHFSQFSVGSLAPNKRKIWITIIRNDSIVRKYFFWHTDKPFLLLITILALQFHSLNYLTSQLDNECIPSSWFAISWWRTASVREKYSMFTRFLLSVSVFFLLPSTKNKEMSSKTTSRNSYSRHSTHSLWSLINFMMSWQIPLFVTLAQSLQNWTYRIWILIEYMSILIYTKKLLKGTGLVFFGWATQSKY